MSLLVQKLPVGATPGKKRLDFDEATGTDAPVHKRPRLDPPPGLTPCLQPLPVSPSPSNQDLQVSQIGPYILLEATAAGRCSRAINRHTGREYTCKVYAAKSYAEVMAPYGVVPAHPNIARLAEVIIGDQNVYIFYQSAKDDMHNYVRRRRRLPEPEAAALFRQMAGAVAHCHQHGVVLRDLKLRKFIFTDGERYGKVYNSGVQLLDYPMDMQAEEFWKLYSGSKLLLENLEDSCVLSGPDDSLQDKHGCPAYVGPEILSSKPSYSGKAADIWSLGVTLYTMLVGCYPFQDTKPVSLFGKIRRARFAVPEALSPKARCLIRCLLRRDPAERLTASEILLHPWLTTGGVPEGSWGVPSGDQGPVQVVPEAEHWRAAEDEEEEVEEVEGLYG